MPVARCSACEITWHRCEQPVVAVSGVVQVAAIVLVIPSIVNISALQRDHMLYVESSFDCQRVRKRQLNARPDEVRQSAATTMNYHTRARPNYV